MSVRVTASDGGMINDNGFSLENVTIMGWFKRNGPNSPWAAQWAFTQGNGQQLRFIGTASDGIVLELFNGNNTQQCGQNWLTSWQHFTCQMTLTTMKFYINGVLVQTFTEEGLGNSSVFLTILTSNAGEWANAEVQDVRFWYAQLSEAEVAAEYASTTPVRTAELFYHWPLVTHTNLTTIVGDHDHDMEALGTLSTGDSQPPGYAPAGAPFVNNPRNLLLLF